jgi:hypothetical protein
VAAKVAFAQALGARPFDRAPMQQIVRPQVDGAREGTTPCVLYHSAGKDVSSVSFTAVDPASCFDRKDSVSIALIGAMIWQQDSFAVHLVAADWALRFP